MGRTKWYSVCPRPKCTKLSLAGIGWSRGGRAVSIVLFLVVPRWITIVSAVVLLAGLGLGLLLQPMFPDQFFIWGVLWGSTGISFGFMLAALGRHLQLKRYVWVGVLGGIGSAAMFVLPLSLGSSVLVLGLAWAVLLIGSGILALRQTWTQIRGGKGND